MRPPAHLLPLSSPTLFARLVSSRSSSSSSSSPPPPPLVRAEFQPSKWAELQIQISRQTLAERPIQENQIKAGRANRWPGRAFHGHGRKLKIKVNSLRILTTGRPPGELISRQQVSRPLVVVAS